MSEKTEEEKKKEQLRQGFECYWDLQGAREGIGDHKERARHAYEAGARSSAPTDSGRAQWLDVLEEPRCFEIRVANNREYREPRDAHTWVYGYAGATRRCRTCRHLERVSNHPPTGAPCPTCGSPQGEKCLSMEDLTYMDTPHPERNTCPVCHAQPGERCVSLSCAKFMPSPHPARGESQ